MIVKDEVRILALGLDKKHFQDKFEFIQNKFKNISCYGSWRPISNDKEISKIDRIDISLLYDQENLFDAFPLVKKTVLEKEFLEAMYECESIFFSTIDRCSSKKISVTKNKSYFNDLLVFFKSFFEIKKDINYVFFPTTPHFPVDIVLFFVAKYFLKKNIILNRTDFNNKFYFRSDWREIHSFEHNFNYKSARLLEPKELQDDSNFIKYSKQLNNQSLKNFGNKRGPVKKIVDNIKQLKLSLGYFKTRDVISPLHLNKHLNWLEIYMLTLKRYKQNRKLSKFYKTRMKEPDLRVNYIYFPLHFQPERSTDPEGLFFSNQTRAIELLRRSIPSSFYIYVKEHPRQFDSKGNSDLRKISARTEDFYKKIINLEKTVLVDIRMDSKLLIKNAKIISSITGSSGWQGILQKKPVFVFGKPWYCSFHKCFQIESQKDIIKAIELIEDPEFKIKQQEIIVFINKIKLKLFDAYIGKMFYDKRTEYDIIVKYFSENLVRYINHIKFH